MIVEGPGAYMRKGSVVEVRRLVVCLAWGDQTGEAGITLRPSAHNLDIDEARFLAGCLSLHIVEKRIIIRSLLGLTQDK